MENFKYLEVFLDWRSYGGTRTSHLLLRWSWCGRSSYLTSFSCTLTAEIERGIQALEMRCYRIQNAIGVHDDLLTMVNKRELRWYGHISRSSGMAKTILQGTVKGARRRGRQKKRWEDNIKEWTGMGFGDSLKAADDREGWKGIVATPSVVPDDL